MNKYILFGFLFSASLLQGGNVLEHTIVLRDGAAVSCDEPPAWFATTQFTMEGKGSVNVANPRNDLQPYISYMRKSGSLTTIQDRLKELEGKLLSFGEKVATAANTTLPEKDISALALMQENFNTAFKEVRMVVTQVERTKELVDKLLHGELDVPITQITNEQVAQLAANLRVITERINDLSARVAPGTGGVSAGPVLQVPHNEQVVAEFTTFLQEQVQAMNAQSGTAQLLSQSVVLPVGNALSFSEEALFDGAGQTITFSRAKHPQLIVTSTGKLTLTNVTLRDIGAHTFHLEPGAELCFGDGVRCEFLEDVSLPAGRISLVGEHTVVDWVGCSGVRTVNLIPDGATGVELALGKNTLCLHDMHVHGSSRLTNTVVAGRTEMDIGAIALCGNATVTVDRDLHVGVVARGRDNTLLCAGAGRNIMAPVMFAPYGDNHLTLQVVGSDDEPVCTFGPETLFLSSTHGNAHLHVGAPAMTWRLQDEHAVILGEHSLLSGGDILVRDHPLCQVSKTAFFDKNLSLRSDGYDAIVYHPHDAIPVPQTTAYERWALMPATEDLVPTTRAAEGSAVTYGGHIQLQRAAGDIVIAGGEVTQFGVDAHVPLNLTLAGEATVVQHEVAAILKPTDVIRVRGKNNRLEIHDRFLWEGTLVCEQGAELTIALSSRGDLHASTALTDAWSLGGAARVTIAGNGQWHIDSSLIIDGGSAGAKPAQLCLSDGVRAKVCAGATVTFAGALNVSMEHGAALHVDRGGMVALGMQSEDVLSFTLDSGSVLDLGNEMSAATEGATASPAIFSAGKGYYALVVQRNGMLRIGRGGVCEINVRDGVSCAGMCAGVRCQYGGRIELTREGTLLVGDNRLHRGVSSPLKWQEYGSGLYGSGVIGLGGASERGLCQQVFPRAEGHCVSGSVRQIVAPLINLTKGLHSTLYFVNSKGEKIVLTAHGVTVRLNDNERIVSDDTTGMIFGTGPQGMFKIKPGGQRL